MTLKVIKRSSRALHRHRNKLILYLYVNYCKVSTGAFSSTRKLGLSWCFKISSHRRTWKSRRAALVSSRNRGWGLSQVARLKRHWGCHPSGVRLWCLFWAADDTAWKRQGCPLELTVGLFPNLGKAPIWLRLSSFDSGTQPSIPNLPASPLGFLQVILRIKTENSNYCS